MEDEERSGSVTFEHLFETLVKVANINLEVVEVCEDDHDVFFRVRGNKENIDKLRKVMGFSCYSEENEVLNILEEWKCIWS